MKWCCSCAVVDALIKVIGLFFFPVVGMLEQTGTGQTAPHAYSHQYAPAAHNYGGYAINQEYGVNTAVPVQEVRCTLVLVLSRLYALMSFNCWFTCFT